MTLEQLSADLQRKFGPDAAQHAMLRIVERGWHLDPGENNVEHFARVVARNFRLESLEKRNRAALYPVEEHHLVAGAGQLDRTILRQEWDRLHESDRLAALGYTLEEQAREFGVPVGTLKSRRFRGLA